MEDYYNVLNSDLVLRLYYTLTGRYANYGTIERYMRGDHALKFATDKFSNAFGGLFREFADNYCRRVIDTLSDYVQLTGVEWHGQEDGDERLEDWLAGQRIDAQQGRIHKSAFAYGDAYAILSPFGDDPQNLRLYRQEPRCVEVLYDPEEPECLLIAMKIWRTLDNRWRLNIFRQDGIYRFETKAARTNVTAAGSNANGELPASLKSFNLVADGEVFVPALVPGRIPVFHFANEPGISGLGVSELSDVKPLQDALNKTVCDMLVAMEFQAYRQRWATGIDIPRDDAGRRLPLNLNGADRLLAIEGDGVRVGEFGQADLEPFLKVAEGFRMEIARLSRIPPHHLSMSDSWPSGEALKTAEAPLVAKIQDRQITWGNTWEDIASYYLATQGINALPADLDAEWKDTTPRSRVEDATAEATEWDTAEKKIGLGVSRKHVLSERGYSDEQILQFEQDNKDDPNRDTANTRNYYGLPGSTMKPNERTGSAAPLGKGGA